MSILAALIGLLLVVILIVSVPVFFGGFGKRGPKTIKGNYGHSLDKSFVKNKWSAIMSTFRLGGSSNLKSSIVEADKLVDYVLVGIGCRGENMGARLKAAQQKFGDNSVYNNLWFAHKVRNNIAHETTHDLNIGEAKRAMEYFEKALRKLGAI